MQGVALSRVEMVPEYESILKSANSMEQIRAVFDGDEELTLATIELIKPFVNLLSERFVSVILHEKPLRVGEVASQDDVDNLFRELGKIDDTLTPEMTTKVCILKCEQLCTYLEEHSRGRHYMFQLKKCFNVPINDILRNEARIDVDGKAGRISKSCRRFDPL